MKSGCTSDDFYLQLRLACGRHHGNAAHGPQKDSLASQCSGSTESAATQPWLLRQTRSLAAKGNVPWAGIAIESKNLGSVRTDNDITVGRIDLAASVTFPKLPRSSSTIGGRASIALSTELQIFQMGSQILLILEIVCLVDQRSDDVPHDNRQLPQIVIGDWRFPAVRNCASRVIALLN